MQAKQKVLCFICRVFILLLSETTANTLEEGNILASNKRRCFHVHWPQVPQDYQKLEELLPRQLVVSLVAIIGRLKCVDRSKVLALKFLREQFIGFLSTRWRWRAVGRLGASLLPALDLRHSLRVKTHTGRRTASVLTAHVLVRDEARLECGLLRLVRHSSGA